MKSDREYIEAMADALEQQGYQQKRFSPAAIRQRRLQHAPSVRSATSLPWRPTDIAALSDVIHGSVASQLRHISMVPVLMVVAQRICIRRRRRRGRLNERGSGRNGSGDTHRSGEDYSRRSTRLGKAPTGGDQ